MKGKFIVLEGLDGCGKSSNLKKLASYLFDKDKDIHILMTREPTMISKYGKKVRELLIEKNNPKENASLFTKLYVNDRKFHVKKIILPALREGCIVLSDRYKYSTFAYQIAQGEKLDKLLKMHKGLPVPDLTIILDISENEALRRLNHNTKKLELFEKIEFLKQVRSNYLKMKDLFPNEKIVVIDAEKSKEEVFEIVKKEVDSIF